MLFVDMSINKQHFYGQKGEYRWIIVRYGDIVESQQ